MCKAGLKLGFRIYDAQCLLQSVVSVGSTVLLQKLSLNVSALAF